MLREEGFESAVTTFPESINRKIVNVFKIPRIGVCDDNLTDWRHIQFVFKNWAFQ
jgi:hypothetical protein